MVCVLSVPVTVTPAPIVLKRSSLLKLRVTESSASNIAAVAFCSAFLI